MTTYRTPAEFADRFDAGSVDRYLRHKGKRFAETMRPERFLALSESADSHRVDPTRISAPTTVVAAENDSIVPRSQLVTLADRLPDCRDFIDLPTRVGHDAFLVETERVSAILSHALA